MDSSDKIERLRERLLVCPVCMDEYKNPRLLPCHHTVCLECIGNILQSSSNTGRLFRCPQCRADVFLPRGGVESFPISFYIQSLQDELGTKCYSSSCDICKKEWMQSQFKCIDCDLDICRFCIHEHRLCHHHSFRHSIIRIETVPSSNNMFSNRTCSKHTEEILQIYCVTCDKAVCITCSCEDHKQHETNPMSRKLKESQKFLQGELDRFSREKREAGDLMKKVQQSIDDIKKSTSTAMHGVDVRSNELRKILDRLEQNTRKSLHDEERKSVHNLSTYKKELQSHFDQLDNGIHFLEELHEGDMCLELLDGFDKFQKTLLEQRKQLLKKKLSFHQMSFQGGIDYQVLNFFALSFGSLSYCKKSISLKQEDDKVLNTKIRPFSLKIVMILMFLFVVVVTLSQFYFSYHELTSIDEDVSIVSIGCILMIYLFMSAICAFLKS